MTERRLRAVNAGEKAPAKRVAREVAPKSVVAAAASGDRRQLLVALQSRIAKAIDDPKTAGPALAALIKQQRDIAAEIHAIDLAAERRRAGRHGRAAILVQIQVVRCCSSRIAGDRRAAFQRRVRIRRSGRAYSSTRRSIPTRSTRCRPGVGRKPGRTQRSQRCEDVFLPRGG